MKRSFVIATTIVTALLITANVQAQTGGAGGMHKVEPSVRDPAGHHRLKGSSLHENAANYHKVAAKHHKIAAAKYRRAKDLVAVDHAILAIGASEDAARATEATKGILPK